MPNASILCLLTVSGESENIFFAFCKEVDESAPPDLYWYKNRGQNGHSNFLWEEKKIKQWMFIASDKEVQTIWSKLIRLQTWSYSWKETVVRFEMPKVNKKRIDEGHVTIKDLCTCGRNGSTEEYELESYSMDISFLIGEENNCSYLEGYKSNKKIKAIDPPGLFGENLLLRSLGGRVCAVFDKRRIFWHIKGDRRSSVKGDPKLYSGFIQASEDFKQEHRVCIRNLDGNDLLGAADIDTLSGQWKVELSEPAGTGQFLLQNKTTGIYYCGEKFYLIKDFKITTNIVHTMLKDLFGREIAISEKQRNTTVQNAIIWDASFAPDTKQSQRELSDKLTEVLLSLGKRIIFNDPYFFGDIKIEKNQIVISLSQKIFLNALITAMAKGEIEEIVIIGYWRRARDVIQGDQQTLTDNYKQIYKLIRKTFEKSRLLILKKFELIFSNEPFHDRYWIGNEDIIFQVSNSIGGAFGSGELSIKKEEGVNLIKIKSRVERRLSNGQNYDLMS
ncbi:MAG TPA: hypothetical protein VKR53_05585 [Puia sp.]|nr:hypothetical protein [Puia sp.]